LITATVIQMTKRLIIWGILLCTSFRKRNGR